VSYNTAFNELNRNELLFVTNDEMNENFHEDIGFSAGYEEYPATKQGNSRTGSHTINSNEMEWQVTKLNIITFGRHIRKFQAQYVDAKSNVVITTVLMEEKQNNIDH